MSKENLHVMEAASNIWQTQWNTICEWFGNDDFKLYLWGTFFVTTGVYWIYGLFHSIIDLTGKPGFLMKYKIKNGAVYPVKLKEFLGAVKNVVFNQITLNFPVIFITYHLMVLRGYDQRKTLPTIHQTLSHIIICILIEEALYFYAHRFLHTSRMFKYHKIHHIWSSPIAISAAYCHPVEHLAANLFPVFLGPLVLGCHLSTLWIWVSIAIIGTMSIHSGFPILLIPNTEFHDAHHEKGNSNYGIIGIMDRLYGTHLKRNEVE